MYLKYYNLIREPFGITPDPAFLFMTESHRTVLASLLYGIGKRKGFISITGEVGSGKTTVLKAFISRINEKHVRLAYIHNPEISFAHLLRTIYEELGIAGFSADLTMSIRRLHHYLIESYRRGQHVVLIVDEAHRMPTETLERLRILSNVETAQDKLLQIVLCGQPELDDVLATRELRQLKQRIAVRASVRPMTPRESLDYLKHRLGRVCYGNETVFDEAALKTVVRHAKGSPRVMNIVCDNALVTGYATQSKPITARLVRQAIRELEPARKALLFRWVRSTLFDSVGGLLGVRP